MQQASSRALENPAIASYRLRALKVPLWANVCGRVVNPAGSGSCAEFQSVSLNLLRLRTLTRLDFGRSVTS